MSEIQSKLGDLHLTIHSLESTARLEGRISVQGWRTVMLDLTGQAQRELIEIYKEILGDAKVNEKIDEILAAAE